jgi:hypothetical protein
LVEVDDRKLINTHQHGHGRGLLIRHVCHTLSARVCSVPVSWKAWSRQLACFVPCRPYHASSAALGAVPPQQRPGHIQAPEQDQRGGTRVPGEARWTMPLLFG